MWFGASLSFSPCIILALLSGTRWHYRTALGVIKEIMDDNKYGVFDL